MTAIDYFSEVDFFSGYQGTIVRLIGHLHNSKRLTRKPTGTHLLVLVLLSVLQGCGHFHTEKAPRYVRIQPDIAELKTTILTDIGTIITGDPGLPHELKMAISEEAITPLKQSPYIRITGSDKATRPIAVTFQRAFEQSALNMVEEWQVSKATAIIHTRKPTTPLCNPLGKALQQTMTPSLRKDPARIKTVEDRSITLRRMAKFGPPLDLYVVYTLDGLKERSRQEQTIYREEINAAQNTSLHDEPLTCSDMPDQIVGASYILTTKSGNTLYFGNNGTQAIEAGEDTVWQFWFGNTEDPIVKQHYEEVFDYLKRCGANL